MPKTGLQSIPLNALIEIIMVAAMSKSNRVSLEYY